VKSRVRADRSTRDEFVRRRMDLGDELRNRREQLGLTQVAVAGLAQVTQGFLSDIESGMRSCAEIGFWVRLANAIQLNSEVVVEKAWRTRGALAFDFEALDGAQRKSLLKLALEKEQQPLVPTS
jgi:transcriptional regulator with XRE-family HTH domain